MSNNNYSEKVHPLFKEMREFVLPAFGNVEVINQKSSNPGDVVTQLDIRVEEFFKERLGVLYPDIGFVGEETGGDRNAARFWLMDPIDGTLHFVRGTPFCTSMLALVEDGKVNFSVIYDFVRDDMYVAERGNGATKNGEKIQVSTRAFRDAVIGVETRFDKQEYFEIVSALRKKAMFFVSLNAGLEHAMVACGKLDARIALDPWGSDYDFAPGTLLIEEAGGVVKNIGSEEYDYRNYNLIAANPILYKELTEGADALFPIA